MKPTTRIKNVSHDSPAAFVDAYLSNYADSRDLVRLIAGYMAASAAKEIWSSPDKSVTRFLRKLLATCVFIGPVVALHFFASVAITSFTRFCFAAPQLRVSAAFESERAS
ncbi:MAG: hypothetical protein ACRCWJ_21295 [Casimicrobium sp.]